MAGDTNCATNLCCSCCTNAEHESSGKKTSAVGLGSDPPLGWQLRQFRHLRECRWRTALWPAPAGRFRHRTAAPGWRKHLARAHDRWQQLERPPLRGTRRSLGLHDITLDGNTFKSSHS